ncbi:MAG: thioredoxin fold domain-containing protein [Cyanothece sp. SIO2G6]|nr:thioredoxin fold domain-containing protein [Cyanothece sp. SIO2G6]
MTSSPPSSNNSASNSPTQTTNSAGTGVRLRNGLIALVAIVLSVALFLSTRNPVGPNTLTALAKASTPLAVAQTNGKPTIMEFYADWCISCQAMAQDMGELKQEYGDRLNFVMLNVDNSKWLPEMAEYRVDGIPHFVFRGRDGEAIASAIGEQPRTIMAANLAALVGGEPLPYLSQQGQTSFLEPSSKSTVLDSDGNDDPRNHGG